MILCMLWYLDDTIYLLADNQCIIYYCSKLLKVILKKQSRINDVNLFMAYSLSLNLD